MTKDQFQATIVHSINQTMQMNYDRIGYSLLRDVGEGDDLITLQTKMIRNSIALSCQISLQLIGDMLEKANIIEFEEPEPEEERPHLRIVNPMEGETPENEE